MEELYTQALFLLLKAGAASLAIFIAAGAKKLSINGYQLALFTGTVATCINELYTYYTGIFPVYDLELLLVSSMSILLLFRLAYDISWPGALGILGLYSMYLKWGHTALDFGLDHLGRT